MRMKSMSHDADDRYALIVLGTPIDGNFKRLANALERYPQIQPIVLDFKQPGRYSLRVSRCGRPCLHVDGIEVSAQHLIWDLIRIVPGTVFYPQGDPDWVDHVAGEWRALYESIGWLFGDRVLNSFTARCSGHKPYQQAVAARVGLRVPETLVTTAKADALAFVQAMNAGSIVKALSAVTIREPDLVTGGSAKGNLRTSRVRSTSLTAMPEQQFASSPSFLQEEIIKDHELRIVVIDETVFAFRIDSQAHPRARLDWRCGSDVISYVPCEISESLRRQLLEFMHQMGLFSGSFDLIVDCNGHEWFLECNQNGMWAWLDVIVDGAIAAAFAQAFAARFERMTPAVEVVTTVTKRVVSA